MRLLTKSLLIFILALLLVSCSDYHDTVLQGYIEGKYIYLSSEVAGDLQKRFVTRGDQVKKGQLLFQLDPNPQKSQLERAQFQLISAQQTLKNMLQGKRKEVIVGLRAQLKQAEANLDYSKKMYLRNKRLVDSGAVNQAAFDQSFATYQSNQQKVAQLKANIAEAKLGAREHQISAQRETVKAAAAEVKRLQWQLSQKTVYSLKAGQIFDAYFRVGEFVPSGQPVLSLLPPENIQLIFFIPEPLLSQIKVGTVVKFSCDACSQKTAATVYYIASQAEYTPPVIYSKDSRAKLVYKVEARINPAMAAKFHPGQPVTIDLDIQRQSHVK